MEFFEFLTGLTKFLVAVWFIIIIAWVIAYVLGLYTVYTMARKRGRTKIGWTLLALFTTPLIPILYLACLGELSEEEKRNGITLMEIKW